MEIKIRIPKLGEFIVDSEFCVDLGSRYISIPKMKYDEPDEKPPTPKSVIFIWDKNNNIYAIGNKFGCSYIARKLDYGTLGYSFGKVGTEHYLFGISSHIGKTFLGLTWIIDKSGKVVGYGNSVPHSLRKLTYASGNKLINYDEFTQTDFTKLIQKSIDDCESRYLGGYSYDYKSIYIPHIYDTAYLNLTIFTFPTYIDTISTATSYSGKYLAARVISNTIHNSYPINLDFYQEQDFTIPSYRYGGWKDLIKLPVLGSIIPIFKKVGRLQVLFNAPVLDLPIFGTSLAGTATYTAILADETANSGIRVNYDSTDSDHTNLFTSPSSNYTDLILTDFVLNDVLNAPAINMYVYHYEPELGMFMVNLKNTDEQYKQTSKSDVKVGWKISDFPIDYYQGQFVDSYMFMDFPLYVKLIPSNFTKRNYGMNGIYYIAENVSMVIGALPITITNNIEEKEHSGKEPINDIYPTLTALEEKQIPTKLQNSNYISQLQPIYITDKYLTVTKDIGNGYLIPIGISTPEPPIYKIITSIIDKHNPILSNSPSESIKGDLTIKLDGVIVYVDGFTEITPYSLTQPSSVTMTIRDYVCSMFNPAEVESFYYKCPSSNLPRSALYATLSRMTSNYYIEHFEAIYSVNYQIKFDKKIVKLDSGLSGCPVIGYDKGDNLLKPIQLSIKAKPESIQVKFNFPVIGKHLSYMQTVSIGGFIFIHFGDMIYRYYPPTEKITGKYRFDFSKIQMNVVNDPSPYPDEDSVPKPDNEIRLIGNLSSLLNDEGMFILLLRPVQETSQL